MFTRWSLRSRMLYQLWFGGILAANSIWVFFIQGPAAIIGVVLGCGIFIAGLATRQKIKRQQAEPPAPPMSWD